MKHNLNWLDGKQFQTSKQSYENLKPLIEGPHLTRSLGLEKTRITQNLG